MFWHKKKLSTQTAQRSFYTPKLLHAKILPRTVFTHLFFSAHTSLYAQNFYAQQFLHRRFYTQAFTQIFFHTQKFVHRARFYTTSSYRDRFVSPSWSPTFRVPPLKFNPNFCWMNWLVMFDEIPIVVDFVHFSCSNPHVSWWNPHCSQWMMSPMTAVLGP